MLVGGRGRAQRRRSSNRRWFSRVRMVFVKFNSVLFFDFFLTSASVSISSLPNHSGSYMSARQSCSRRDASCMAERHTHTGKQQEVLISSSSLTSSAAFTALTFHCHQVGLQVFVQPGALRLRQHNRDSNNKSTDTE